MLTEQDLHELIAYRPVHPVLSVYLSVEPQAGSADAYKLRLRQMIKELGEGAAADGDAVQRFVEHEYGWTGRSLAMFSCVRERYFRSYPLAVDIRSRSRLMDRPYVKPLADLLDSYGYYGVALVDQQGARLFHFHLGELREQVGTLGEAVHRIKRGGGPQLRGRRAHATDDVADRNLKEAARFSSEFFEAQRVRRVLIAGSDATVTRFRTLLPKTWQSLVVGTFPMDMAAGHAQVLEKALSIAGRAETAREDRMIETVVTAAAKGREGVVQLDETLDAVHAGRVQTLLFQDGFRAPGYRCTGCGHLTARSAAVCAFCGGSYECIEDAVELAVRKVIADGGEVEVVHGNTSLQQAGEIGGLLRY
jgi:peptide chain release factor subunit 1